LPNYSNGETPQILHVLLLTDHRSVRSQFTVYLYVLRLGWKRYTIWYFCFTWFRDKLLFNHQ